MAPSVTGENQSERNRKAKGGQISLLNFAPDLLIPADALIS
jgi:hypothetical protein